MSKLLETRSLGNYLFEVYDDKPEIDLIEVRQTHGNCVLNADSVDHESEADGIVTEDKTLAIKTADCLPIVIIGMKGSALIHVGWRGIANEILKNPLIASIVPDVAYIGPHILVSNFEVTAEFTENFPKSDNFAHRDDKLYFNMKQEVIDQLKKIYSGIKIEASNTCTFENTEYNSYRRNKTQKRNWNILRRI